MQIPSDGGLARPLHFLEIYGVWGFFRGLQQGAVLGTDLAPKRAKSTTRGVDADQTLRGTWPHTTTGLAVEYWGPPVPDTSTLSDHGGGDDT